MAEKTIHDGKVAKSKKFGRDQAYLESGNGRQLALPAYIREFGKDQEITFRWVDANEMHTNSGYHKNGWRPFSTIQAGLDKDPKSYTSVFGRDPDGLVRRGGMILAYRTDEEVVDHRQRIKKLRDIVHRKATSQGQMEALRESELGRKFKIDNKFDD